jgi:rod shape-determining protein MreD
MKKAIFGFVAVAAALGVQVALSRLLPAVSERLDLLLVVVVYYGVSGAQMTAMLIGASAGLLQDVWFGVLLGRTGVRKVMTGYLVGAVGSRLALEGPLAHAPALALATIADHATGVVAGELIGAPLADPFSWMLLQKALVNAVVGTACFALVGRLTRERERRRTARARRPALRGAR